MVLAIEAVTSTLDIFTPLTGRTGKEAPSEIIVAVISSIISLIFFPSVIPLFHRLSRRSQRYTLISLAALTVAVIAVFAGPFWETYDFMHPKRMGMQYNYNVSAGFLGLLT